jgi:hypothetical protein
MNTSGSKARRNSGGACAGAPPGACWSVRLSRALRATAMLVALVLSAVTGVSEAVALTPQGTVFTYQGRLDAGGTPYSGSADFRFRLFTQENGGSQVGPTLDRTGVAVLAGTFRADLDFGAQFPGEARYLEIAVRTPAWGGGGSGPAFTTLQPRQRLNAVPYALYALSTNTPFVTTGNQTQLNGLLGIGTAPTFPLSVAGIIESTFGGFRFPDGTVQTSAAVSGLRGVIEFSTPGDSSFQVPAGVTSLLVEVWGAGGGGGGGCSGYNSTNAASSFAGGGGGGGGSGAYARSVIPVVPGTTLTIRVGAGGGGGSGGQQQGYGLVQPGTSGQPGGATSVLSGTTVLVTAAGGLPGAGGTIVPIHGPGLGGAGGQGGAVISPGQIRRGGAAGVEGQPSGFGQLTPTAGGGPSRPGPSGTIAPLGSAGGAGGFGGGVSFTGGFFGLAGGAGSPGQAGYVIIHY